ncbi:death domain-associated protein 6 isoform X2 [Hippocampus zosterae]|uniref:death domain-associated protein 6 isoform X2 n=1 Tax=Hippocampus zosterae TaxID=109293 RepID=UPI00223CE36A|nr:death domain-associated protein 6 isoform X2 [Hippocampus zosterae]
MADVIVVDEEDVPRPPSSTLASSSSPRRVQLTTATHVTQSTLALANKNKHVLQAENHKLFSEFMEHVVAVTQDCPQVLEYLKMNHAKARTDYLSSVEFRNSLGRCLTRLEAKRSRVFVYIYELCMVLKQHKDRSRKKKKRETPSTSASDCLHSTLLKSESQTAETGVQVQEGNPAAQDEKPSTSGLQEDQQKEEEEASRASRKQIAYLENLLKVYDDEICRLQRTELSLEDLDAEDSLYIQEHKLKRKMMKIYNKLCELKDCSLLTGRILERKILYSDTSYPEISRKIQRYINSPEVCLNPPDYQDILQQVQLASKRHNLQLSSKELERIARKAFTDTGSKIQQRRHHDLLYDFGCQLTSEYRPDNDPALKDPTLLRKLENNRELGLNRLEDVINKYAIQQDNADKKDRARRHFEESDEEEEEDDGDDVSSEADIEEEIQASNQQNGPDGGNEAEKMSANSNEEVPTMGNGRVAAATDDEAVTSRLLPDAGISGISALSSHTSAIDSPSQSESTQPCESSPDENAPAAASEPTHPANQVTRYQSSGTDLPVTLNGAPLPLTLEMTCHSPITNGTSPPLSSTPNYRLSRSHKRKMLDAAPKRNHIDANDRDVEVLLDMGVICASPLRAVDRSDCQPVSSSQSPPPKKYKVNVATQCDPLEIIELSDSE